MKRLKHLSIPTKLKLLSGATITLALVVASFVSLVYNARTTKNAKIQQLTTLAEVLASNSAAAVSFGQSESAEQLLESLRYYPTVENAVIFDVTDDLFAVYNRNEDSPWSCNDVATGQVTYGEDGDVQVFVPITESEEVIGKIGLRDSLRDLQQTYWSNVAASAMIVTCSLVLGIIVAIPLQRSISRPLINLATAAKQITQNMDFSLRVHHKSHDEIGVLYEQFNTMLQRVEQSSLEARAAKRDLEILNVGLEQRVHDRTRLLEETNRTLEQNVRERDEANEELKQTQTKLIETSRKAGMADIANGVLHNIGNVLNSLNVSAAVAHEKLQTFPVTRLEQVAELLESHQDDIAHFMTGTSQGQKLPRFLAMLVDRMDVEQKAIGAEIRLITKHIDHIKDIVSAQQSLAGTKGVVESCEVSELFEDALQFLGESVKRHHIELIRDYAPLAPVKTEKAKLIQMLVNLIKNAKESVLQHGGEVAQVTVRTLQVDSDHVGFQVADTGVGISQDQLTRVFSQGFTTKPDGNGFGLHASANLASELGGSLNVTSEGLGCGATFTIVIPHEKTLAAKGQAKPAQHKWTHLSGMLASDALPSTSHNENALG